MAVQSEPSHFLLETPPLWASKLFPESGLTVTSLVLCVSELRSLESSSSAGGANAAPPVAAWVAPPTEFAGSGGACCPSSATSHVWSIPN
eukprot:55811-Amphidinium_carterae.1